MKLHGVVNLNALTSQRGPDIILGGGGGGGGGGLYHRAPQNFWGPILMGAQKCCVCLRLTPISEETLLL